MMMRNLKTLILAAVAATALAGTADAACHPSGKEQFDVMIPLQITSGFPGTARTVYVHNPIGSGVNFTVWLSLWNPTLITPDAVCVGVQHSKSGAVDTCDLIGLAPGDTYEYSVGPGGLIPPGSAGFVSLITLPSTFGTVWKPIVTVEDTFFTWPRTSRARTRSRPTRSAAERCAAAGARSRLRARTARRRHRGTSSSLRGSRQRWEAGP